MEIKRFKEIIKYIAVCISGSEIEGHVYAVGGCVRDSIMENEISDIDIAVDLPEGGKKLGDFLYQKDLLLHKYVEYPAYSVCQFVLKEFPDVELEAVQTRKEKYDDTESRNPVTAFGTIEEDCYRRDLTINSLYMNVGTEEILDITGRGVNDIKRGLCVTPLDPVETFDDDPLRMLRVGRFMSRFNFQVAYQTFQGIQEKKERLLIISKERIREEFVKMLSDKSAGIACQFLKETGLLEVLFPDMNFSELGINYFFTGIFKLHRFGYLTKLAFLLLAVCDDDRESAYNFLKTLTFSNDEIKNVMSMFNTVNRYKELAVSHNCERSDVYKECWIAGSYEYLDMCLEILTCFKSHNTYYYGYFIDYLRNVAIDTLFERGCVNFFRFKIPMNGDEIMEEFGLKPGKEIKIVQDWMMDWIFQHPLFEKEDMVKYIHDCL